MRNILLLILFSISISGFSQYFNHKGTLIDSKGPITGAEICVERTEFCKNSDLNGKYSIYVKVGDKLIISVLGIKTKEIIIDERIMKYSLRQLNSEDFEKVEVEKIENSDFLNQLKSNIDTLNTSKVSGTFSKNDFPNFDQRDSYYNSNLDWEIRLITKKRNQFYKLKKKNEYNKMHFELNNESTFSQVIRKFDFQKTYSQGRSLNGEFTYQSPLDNENFSWGNNIKNLQNSTVSSEFYPNGNIINKQTENSKPLDLFQENDFFENAFNFKTSFAATIQNPSNDYLTLKLVYNRNENTIPENSNRQINTSLNGLKHFKNNHSINAGISINNFEYSLSNSNFIVNKIIFANAITPIHFDNKAGFLLQNNQSRSFSNAQKNPFYLLTFNQDKNKSNFLSVNINYEYKKYRETIKSNILFQNCDIENSNTNLPYKSDFDLLKFDIRKENYQNLSFSNTYKREDYSDNFIETRLDYRFDKRNLNRNFFDSNSNINISNDNSLKNQINNIQNRHNLVWNVNGKYQFNDVFNNYYENLILKASTDLNYSSTLKNNYFINFNGSIVLENIFERELDFFGSFDVNRIEPSMQNNNLNFNTLKFKLSEFNSINNQSEIFTNINNIATTEKQTSFGAKYYKYGFDLNANLYHKNISDLYAPILENNQFLWKPAIDYFQNGLEIDLRKNWNFRNNKSYSIGLNFTMYRNEVTNIKNGQKSIAIAGFSDINKSYIEGQPLGVFVGNSYLRNHNNELIIDTEGFPILDSNSRIIGNPNPDFVVGLDNSFKIKNFIFNLNFDWHQGGQIWNGTQQALNYYGKSQQTENERTIQNYIFNGVTQPGETNTKPVNFYDSNLPVDKNRWVRYGIAGLSEDNIEDASYFRLNNFSISYDKNIKEKLLYFKISLFANNIFIISKNKSAFINNSLFNAAETTGLEYFNAPMTRTTGLTITIKY